MKVSELAQICGAKVEGDGSHEITDVALIKNATRAQICFVTQRKYLRELDHSHAGAVIVPPGMTIPQGMTALRQEDPDRAFSKCLTALRGEVQHPAPGISEHAAIGKRFVMGDGASIGAFACIADGVTLGKNVVIYPYVFLGDEVEIGDDTVLYPGVRVLEKCTIGKRCMLYPGATIGSDGFGYHFVGVGFEKAPQRGTVVLEDDVAIGANSCVDRARFDVTRICKGTKLDNLCQVGHNVTIGQHCVIAAISGIGGSAVVGDYVQMGGFVGIADHMTVGMGVKLAAKTGVIQDVAPGMKMAGFPADEARRYLKREIQMRKFPEVVKRLKTLEIEVKELREAAEVAAQDRPTDGPETTAEVAARHRPQDGPETTAVTA